MRSINSYGVTGCNMSTSLVRVLQPGSMGLDVLLVQTALGCHASEFTGLSSSRRACYGLFSRELADFGRLTPIDGKACLNPGPDFAMYPLIAGTGDPATFPGFGESCLAMLPCSLWGRRHYMRGIIGGMLRGRLCDPPWSAAALGFYCPRTADAVKAFQARYALATTGCVDLATWQRLFPRYRLHLNVPSLLQTPAFVKPGKSASDSGTQHQTGTGNTAGSKPGRTTASPPKPPPTPPPAAADKDDDDDDRVALTLGVNSDSTLSVEAEFLLAKKKWKALGRELGVKATVDGELHQPLGSSLGRYGNLKFSVQVEDIWTSKRKFLSLDGFGEAVYQQPFDSGQHNDNDHVVGLHAGADFNINLPTVVQKSWLKPLVPKLTFEGTAGPEHDFEKNETSPVKFGAELKATWEF